MTPLAHKTDILYHSGERRLKLVGDNCSMDVNAEALSTASALTSPTLYPSPYLVLTEKGYTKHYYAGTERLAARLGCGGLAHIREDVELSANANQLFGQCLEIIESNEMAPIDVACIKVPEPYEGELKLIDPEVIPVSLVAEVAVDIKGFQIMMENVSGPCHWNHSFVPGEGGPTSWKDAEEVYFYHSDHLGSASWITDHHGDAIQHLQYLPFGAPFVDQRASGYHERFTFTGKERDEETGYGYFGARYMDHELMTGWLSVDPMADKYPNISPYAYCAWNPVKLVDPDGREIKFDPESEEIVQKFEERIKNKKTETTCTPEARAEYDAALAEIKKLRGSDQMYHIEQGSSGNYFYSGGTSYDLGNNRVSITYNGSDASLAHELKHAYQFETGKLSFLTSTGASWDAVLYDVTDEYDAYERARAFGGEKVTMDYLKHRYNAPIHDSDGYFYPFKKPPENPKENDHNIYGGKNTERSLKADTNPNSPGLKGNIFRLNGVTYIK